MRVEYAVAASTPGGAQVTLASSRRRIDPVELAVLAAFAAVSVWVLALDLWQVVAHGLVWTGTDGFFVIDQLQYLAWIRDASHHLLASNLFVLRPTPADYFQPAVVISGLISALGVAPWLSLLLWKPVAVLGTFCAVRAFAYRTLEGRSQRHAALALGLFFGSFSVVYGQFGVVGDLFPGFLSWGYPFGLLALAAMLASLLSYARARGEGARAAIPALPAVLGALASSLHPWQGEVLIVTLVLTELAASGLRSGRAGRRLGAWRGARLGGTGWRGTPRWRDLDPRARRRLKLLALTVGATAVPLIYYGLLGRLDVSWGLAREASRHNFSFWTVLLAIAPLAIPAALGYRVRAKGFLAIATRVWPIAALVVYLLSASELSATPLHAFEGITVPLAVLAVSGLKQAGWRRLPRSQLLGVLAVAAATVPATVYELSVAHEFMGPTAGNPNFITRDERAALQYLSKNRERGGVLTRFYLGSVVPARTGRRTFVGNCLWSEPRCTPRAQIVQQLFDGNLLPAVARYFVQQTGARFILTDCQSPPHMSAMLAPLILSIHQFGCSSVYELDAPGAPYGPLAESPLHAAVRAPWR